MVTQISVKQKIMLLSVFFLMGFVLLQVTNSIFKNRINDQVVFPAFEKQMIADQKAALKALVDVEADMLGQRLNGLANREEKLKVVVDETDPIRFFEDRSGYFFTYDLNGIRINVPINKNKNGQNMRDDQDKKGNRYVDEFIKTVRNGGGYVEYFFEKEGKGIQPKLSYVRAIPNSDFFIGTGVYLDNVATQSAALRAQIETAASRYFYISLAIFMGLLLLIGGVTYYLGGAIASSLKQRIQGLLGHSDQVASASSQVNVASQSLAEGTSEQAAAIEEISSSLEEISSMTRQNADNARQARSLSTDTKKTAETCAGAMQEMAGAIGQVNEASQETQKIVKTIDEVAFQTNLLALNAAVEAARAGEAGAGFAVVADEVRNLAMRAAEAAKNTSGQIENIVKKIDQAMELVFKSIDEFARVDEYTGKVNQLVGEIAEASGEQAQGIEQVNRAVSEMDKVVQRNAASAEESASASAEMDTQAAQLREIVDSLVALIDGRRGAEEPRRAVGSSESTRWRQAPPAGKIQKRLAPLKRPALTREVDPKALIPLDDDDFKSF